jgi:hypothetical protein
VRQMTTLRKEPMIRPKTPQKTANTAVTQTPSKSRPLVTIPAVGYSAEDQLTFWVSTSR